MFGRITAAIERIQRDKLLHFSSCVVLGLAVKITAQLFMHDRIMMAAVVFVIVTAVQLIDEYVIQQRKPGRNARDWRDAAAGTIGGITAASLVF